MEILLIDADAHAAAQMGDRIRALGHHVVYADGKTLAVRPAKAAVFDAILVACRGPHIDCVKLCRRLSVRLGRSTVLFVLDEHSSVSRTVAVLEAGADAYAPQSVSV